MRARRASQLPLIFTLQHWNKWGKRLSADNWAVLICRSLLGRPYLLSNYRAELVKQAVFVWPSASESWKKIFLAYPYPIIPRRLALHRQPSAPSSCRRPGKVRVRGRKEHTQEARLLTVGTYSLGKLSVVNDISIHVFPTKSKIGFESVFRCQLRIGRRRFTCSIAHDNTLYRPARHFR